MNFLPPCPYEQHLGTIILAKALFHLLPGCTFIEIGLHPLGFYVDTSLKQPVNTGVIEQAEWHANRLIQANHPIHKREMVQKNAKDYLQHLGHSSLAHSLVDDSQSLVSLTEIDRFALLSPQLPFSSTSALGFLKILDTETYEKSSPHVHNVTRWIGVARPKLPLMKEFNKSYTKWKKRKQPSQLFIPFTHDRQTYPIWTTEGLSTREKLLKQGEEWCLNLASPISTHSLQSIKSDLTTLLKRHQVYFSLPSIPKGLVYERDILTISGTDSFKRGLFLACEQIQDGISCVVQQDELANHLNHKIQQVEAFWSQWFDQGTWISSCDTTNKSNSGVVQSLKTGMLQTKRCFTLMNEPSCLELSPLSWNLFISDALGTLWHLASITMVPSIHADWICHTLLCSSWNRALALILEKQ